MHLFWLLLALGLMLYFPRLAATLVMTAFLGLVALTLYFLGPLVLRDVFGIPSAAAPPRISSPRALVSPAPLTSQEMRTITTGLSTDEPPEGRDFTCVLWPDDPPCTATEAEVAATLATLRQRVG